MPQACPDSKKGGHKHLGCAQPPASYPEGGAVKDSSPQLWLRDRLGSTVNSSMNRNGRHQFIRGLCFPNKIWTVWLQPPQWNNVSPGNTSHKFIKHTEWRNPILCNKVGNMGRNWICPRISLSLDLALGHPTKLQDTLRTILEVGAAWPSEHTGQQWKESSPFPSLLALLFIFLVLFCISDYPFRRRSCTKQPASFLEQPQVYS